MTFSPPLVVTIAKIPANPAASKLIAEALLSIRSISIAAPVAVISPERVNPPVLVTELPCIGPAVVKALLLGL